MPDITKTKKVKLIEEKEGKSIEEILIEFENFHTPIKEQGMRLGVSGITIIAWRKKLGFSRKKGKAQVEAKAQI